MSGGTVVFVGNHAFGGYKGSNIARLIPVEFDYSKLTKGAAHITHDILNDRAPYATLEPPVKDSPITNGLDYSAPPQVSVYNNKVKNDSVVLLKAGSNPVLSCRKAGKGIVYSFPVCLTPNYHIPYDNDEPEYEGSSVIPIKAEPPGERDKSIFMWSQYDSLWYGLATAAIHGEGAIAAKEKPAPQQKVSFSMVVGDWKGLCKVYRRGYQFPVNISFSDAARGDIALSLVDPWNKTVCKNTVKYQDTQVSLKIPTEGLAFGQYTVIAERDREQIKDLINILPDYRYRENLFITTLGGPDFSDDAEDQYQLLKEAKEDGLNLIRTTDQYRPDLIRWPARWRRELAERVMLSGMVPAHMDQIAGGWGSPAHQSDEELTRDVQASLGMLERFWGMAPRGIMTYIFDEPGHLEFVKDCKVCNDEYLKRYGGESVPKEKGTPGYYNLASIMDRAAIDGWIRKAKIWHEKDTEKLLTPWGITNEGSLLMEHSVWLARSWGGYGVDMFSYSPGNWQAQYAFDMALAAADYDPCSLGFQIEAGSYYGGTPIAAQRGQSMYSVLARGARLIQWFDWGWTKIQGKLGIMPRVLGALEGHPWKARR